MTIVLQLVEEDKPGGGRQLGLLPPEMLPEHPADDSIAPLRPATDGLLALAAASPSLGFRLTRVHVQNTSWMPTEDHAIEDELVELLRSGRASDGRILLHRCRGKVVADLELHHLATMSVLKIHRLGTVELGPSVTPQQVAEVRGDVLRLVRTAMESRNG